MASTALIRLRHCAGRYNTASSSPPSWVRFKSSNNKSKPESLFQSAAEYYSSLRWKVATSLTQSLSKDEQQELLGRLSIDVPKEQQVDNSNKKKEEDESKTQHSIAEAVAAARAEEAQKQTAKWEKEKARLEAEAEKAARERVETDLVVQQRRMAFERWQRDVQNEKDAKEKAEKENNDVAATTTPEAAAAVEEEEETTLTNNNNATIVEEPTAVADHPVLGSAISDLGYKRVHIASVQALKSLPVWRKQRTYRHKRAQSMAQDKMKTLHLGMPGIIALHEDSNGALSIIDGQHRVAMMTILEEQKKAKANDTNDGSAFFDLDRILVEVFPEDKQPAKEGEESSTHAQDIFLEINKAEPVKLVDLPGVVGLTKSDRTTINEGAARLEEAFPTMFSSSQRCRVPHLNIDNLRDALFASEVVKRHGLKSPKALETWMLEQNQLMKKDYTSKGSQKAASVAKSALDKAIKQDFFLGLDSAWLYA